MDVDYDEVFERIREGVLDTTYYNAIRFPGIRYDTDSFVSTGNPEDDYERREIIFDGDASQLFYPPWMFRFEYPFIKIFANEEGNIVSRQVGLLPSIRFLKAEDFSLGDRVKRVPEDYQDIQSAIDDMSRTYRDEFEDFDGIISVGADYVMEAPIKLKNGGDYSHIAITSRGQSILTDIDFETQDYVLEFENCITPVFKCGFRNVNYTDFAGSPPESATNFCRLINSTMKMDRDPARDLNIQVGFTAGYRHCFVLTDGSVLRLASQSFLGFRGAFCIAKNAVRVDMKDECIVRGVVGDAIDPTAQNLFEQVPISGIIYMLNGCRLTCKSCGFVKRGGEARPYFFLGLENGSSASCSFVHVGGVDDAFVLSVDQSKAVMDSCFYNTDDTPERGHLAISGDSRINISETGIGSSYDNIIALDRDGDANVNRNTLVLPDGALVAGSGEKGSQVTIAPLNLGGVLWDITNDPADPRVVLT